MAESTRRAGLGLLLLSTLGLLFVPVPLTEGPAVVNAGVAEPTPALPGALPPCEAEDAGLQPPDQLPPVYDNVYYHYWDLREHMQELRQDHPDILELGLIGHSVGGEADPSGDYGQLMMARVTNLADTGPKPEIYIDGGHHGNEPLGMELAVMVLDTLVANYGSNATITQVVDSYDIYIVPMINVDGNTYDQRTNANGVDLNRNYPYHWAGAGSGPASEPEVASNVAFFEAHDFQLYISMHTGTEMFLTPWAYTPDNTTDVVMYTRLAAELESRTGFPSGAAGKLLYTAQGTALDYGYWQGMPSITPEVDNEQWGQLTVEQKRQRLDAVFTGTMYMLENFPLFGAYPVVTDARYSREIQAGDPFTVSFDMENIGYGPLRNGSFRVEGEGFTAGTGTRLVEALEPGNTTTLDFAITPRSKGELTLYLEGSYQVLLIANSTVRTLSQASYPTVDGGQPPSPTIEVTVEEAGRGRPGWTLLTGALVVLTAGGLVLMMRDRRG